MGCVKYIFRSEKHNNKIYLKVFMLKLMESVLIPFETETQQERPRSLDAEVCDCDLRTRRKTSE